MAFIVDDNFELRFWRLGAYARFYNSPQTDDMRDIVWAWLQDDAKSLFGLVATDERGEIVGIAH